MTILRSSSQAMAFGLVVFMTINPVNAAAQTAGNSGAAVAGAALGMAAGATFGTVGSIFPCARTYAGHKCVRTAAIIGTVLGAGSGLSLGSVDSEAIERMATGGAIGFAIGSGLGLVVKQVILYSTWGDVLGAGAIGMAVGTSPKGALIGMTVGGAIGITLWQVVPKFDLVNATEVTLLGMAAGGIISLVYRGVAAQAESNEPTVFFPIRLTF